MNRYFPECLDDDDDDDYSVFWALSESDLRVGEICG